MIEKIGCRRDQKVSIYVTENGKEVKREFSWGKVHKVHSVNNYSIVEYTDHHNELLYHGYDNGHDTCCGYYSLDEALLGLIARRHDGINSQAGMFMAKMIGIREK